VSTGPVVTAPGLSTSAASPSSTAEEPSTPAPEPPATSAPEPAPEPEITAEPAQSYDPGPEPAPAPAPAPAPPAPAPAGSGGITVVIDPGHNGANGANPGIINALVPAGFGQTKPCNTTGTSTDAGYDEHIFTWRVANDLEPILRASGINVIMTRPSDDGVGPCRRGDLDSR
jgi:N-acetylmuramoyl-L-alanine amidase